VDAQAKENIVVLRQYEGYCYQVSYYLLQDAQLSNKATKAALLELYCDNDFLKGDSEVRKKKVKQVAIRSSLRAKATLYQGI